MVLESNMLYMHNCRLGRILESPKCCECTCDDYGPWNHQKCCIHSWWLGVLESAKCSVCTADNWVSIISPKWRICRADDDYPSQDGLAVVEDMVGGCQGAEVVVNSRHWQLLHVWKWSFFFNLKGTVSRDYLLKFFFLNHLPPSPWK
jgi:hypothetical protein